MTRTISRELVLLGLGLTLTACSAYEPLAANCFTQALATAEGARESEEGAPVTLSTRGIALGGQEVGDSGTRCHFTPLGAGN